MPSISFSLESYNYKDRCTTVFLETVLREGGTVVSFLHTGALRNGLTTVRERLKGLALKEVSQIWNIWNPSRSDYVYVRGDAWVHISSFVDGKYSIQVHTNTEKLATDLADLVREEWFEREREGSVQILVRNRGTLQFEELGIGAQPLIEGNYTEDTLASYGRAVDDLKTSTPRGRIVLLEGPTGTGKSFMIRAFLHDVPEAMFCLVPSELVSSLTGPEFINILMEHCSEHEGPVVLILEDADEVLVPRGMDNMGGISALLNLGDGLVGSLLDVRLLCTTNAKVGEVDRAILRKGRMSEHISVQSLPGVQATRVLSRLLGKAPDDIPVGTEGIDWFADEVVSLADVYSKARDLGWAPTKPSSEPSRQLPGRVHR